MIMIGLTGPKGVGKTTVAHELKTVLEAEGRQPVHVISFAAPLKAMVSAMLAGAGLEALEKYAKEEKLPVLGVSPRRLMQTLGTEWGRNEIHPDLWVRLMSMRIQSVPALYYADVIIIDDLRFANEQEMVEQMYGGRVIALRAERAMTGDPHPSEHPVDTGLVVDNSQSPAVTARAILQLMEIPA